MAGRWPNAALKDQHWPNDLRLNGSTLPTAVADRLTTGGLARSITQASTLQMAFQNGDRYITSHWAANPFANPPPNYVYGIPSGFNLVQIAKQGPGVTLTAEDAVINHLRGISGTKVQAPGTRTFVDFCRQLCADAGVPIIADNAAAPLQTPVSRGGTNAPNEDTWTCLKRLADDRGWYCFSDGTSIILGPASWLLSGSPAMTISEASYPRGGTLVDTIDGSMDSGKPTAQISVTTQASLWAADPGAFVRVAPGIGPLSGDWICTDINRQNLASDQLAVSLAAPTPPKAEPAASNASSTSTDKPAPTTTVTYGSVSQTVWNNLLQQGYTPQGGGGGNTLVVKQSDFALAKL